MKSTSSPAEREWRERLEAREATRRRKQAGELVISNEELAERIRQAGERAKRAQVEEHEHES